MGYGFKYSNAAVNIDNTLRKVNTITTGGHAANPSNNFHSGIAVVSNKHTIVQVFSSGDPNYWSLEDYELIELVNLLGSSALNVVEAKDYIQSQDDFFYVDNAAYDNSVLDDVASNFQAGYDSSFVNNLPTTNLITSTSTMYFAGDSSGNWTYQTVAGGGGVSDENPRKGSYSFKLIRENGDGEVNCYWSGPGYQGSTTYTFSMLVWCNQPGMAMLFTYLAQTNGSSAYHPGDSKWHELSFQFTTTAAGAAQIRFSIQVGSGNYPAVAYFDCAQIEIGSTATGFVEGTRSQNTNFNDLSGNSNNLTGTGTSNIPTFDSTNKSISLDGAAQRFGSSTNCGVVGDQTLEAVFLEDAGTAPHTTVICTDVGYQYGIKLMSFKNNNRYGFWLGYGNSNHLGMISGNLDNDVIYHLLGTYKASTGQVKIYLNGELKMTDTMPETGNVSLNDGKINLGIDYHGLGTGYSMNGNIFSSKIYNKVLTQSEVNHNYFGGSIVTNNLVFNADAGTPVSYENGSSTAYSTTGSIDGTLNNGVDFTFENGGSWVFDGTDDFINFGSDTPIDFIYSDPFSLEVWLNADNTSGFKHLIGKSFVDYRLALSGAGISFRLDSNNLTTQTGLIVAGEWTHIVATWEPSTSTARVYQDGVFKVAITDTSVDWTSTGNNFQMGTSPGEAYYIQGKMPIGRAYSKTLSLLEVQQNYIALKPRFPS